MATLSQKIVLITGTSTGIGFTTAITFAGAPGKKYKVYATMRNMEEKKSELEHAAGDLLNDTLVIKELDVADEASRVKCVEEILRVEKRIDILINNAYYTKRVPFEALDLINDGPQEFQTNYFGPLRLMQLVLPGMRERKWGRILNISSTAAIGPRPFIDLYAHAKRALEAATESVGVTARPFNVWVSAIQLGAVLTPRLTLRYYNKTHNPFPDIHDAIEDETLKKMSWKAISYMRDLFNHPTCQTSEEVSKFIMETAEIDKPVMYYQPSEFTRRVAAKTYVDPTGEERVKLYEAGDLSIA